MVYIYIYDPLIAKSSALKPYYENFWWLGKVYGDEVVELKNELHVIFDSRCLLKHKREVFLVIAPSRKDLLT